MFVFNLQAKVNFLEFAGTITELLKIKTKRRVGAHLNTTKMRVPNDPVFPDYETTNGNCHAHTIVCQNNGKTTTDISITASLILYTLTPIVVPCRLRLYLDVPILLHESKYFGMVFPSSLVFGLLF